MGEKNGDLEGASSIINELHVETYGTMDRKEKVEFILEQMRLTIANKDMVRAQIISKKISTRYFQNEKEEVQELKLKYYNLMIELDMKEKKYLQVSKHFQQINTTPIVTKDESKARDSFISCTLFCILSEIGPEQQSHLNLLNKDKQLEDLPLFKNLIGSFLTQELMNWNNIQQQYGADLKSKPVIFDSVSSNANEYYKTNECRRKMAKQDGYLFTIELSNIILELFQNATPESEQNVFLNIWTLVWMILRNISMI